MGLQEGFHQLQAAYMILEKKIGNKNWRNSQKIDDIDVQLVERNLKRGSVLTDLFSMNIRQHMSLQDCAFGLAGTRIIQGGNSTSRCFLQTT